MKTRATSSNLDVKKANRNRIYRLIYQSDGISRPEMVQKLEMSLPTVMQNLKTLFDSGLIKVDGNLESTGGRKAAAIYSVKDARLAAGVEITTNHVGIVLADMEGVVVKNMREKLPFAPDREYADKVGAAVKTLIASSEVDPSKILGAGVAMPGVFTADGKFFDTTVIPVKGYPTAMLEEAIGMPCAFLNAANAAGIAEMWGSEPGRSFAYLSLNNTVGGAIVLDGKLEVGDNQCGGEFGHIIVDRSGFRCHCGQRGCLSAYCNATVLSDKADGDLDAFFALLETGDPWVRPAWDDYLDYLAHGVNILRVIFDCDVVVGGYVGAHMEKHMPELRQRVGRLNVFGADCDYLKVCRRRTEGSAVGAALVHIERFIRNV